MRRLLAVLLLALVAGCVQGAPAAPASWDRLPDPPLSSRTLPVVAWSGSEVLVLGGDTAPPCPPSAGCVDPPQPQGDGAAYDPVTRTWRTTAPAPRPPVGSWVTTGDVVWTQTGEDGDDPLLSYDASDDTWTLHDPPPGAARAAWRLAAARGLVVALRDAQRPQHVPDAVYDPRTRRWTALPRDPLAPSFPRTGAETALGLLVSGAEDVPDPGSARPTLLRAALLDVEARTWRRLPDSDQLPGAGIAVHGDRAVYPDLGGADGGAVGGYGRRVPSGGVLDLAAERWERLPDPPGEHTGGWPVSALGGPVSATDGWLYDDRARAWSLLPRPDDAPPRPGTAVWAGDLLVVVGGIEPGRGVERPRRVPGAWALRVR